MSRLRWRHVPQSDVCAALEIAGDYVISHRPASFTLSYRPAGQHVALGTFISLEIAKNQAKNHHRAREVKS